MRVTNSEPREPRALLDKDSASRFSVLRLTLSIGETSAAYNQFSLACQDRYDITLVTFFRSALRPPTTIKYYEGDGSFKGFFGALRKALASEKYDVVHIHAPHVGFLYYLAAPFNRQAATLPSVYTVHSSIPNYQKTSTRLLLIPNFIFSQQVVCCSRSSFSSVPSFYRRLAGRRLTFVQNGVDLGRIDRSRSGATRHARESFLVCTVGRLIDVKNPFAVLKAYEISVGQEGRLVFVGRGPLESSLRRQADGGWGGPTVEITGLVSRDRVYAILAEADLFVSASYGEGLPIATLEAMASRCPVILSDIPPHREIADGAGFVPLLRPDDVDGFAREIRRFKDMGVMERRAIGEKCRALIEERFALDGMHEGYDRIYRKLVRAAG